MRRRSSVVLAPIFLLLLVACSATITQYQVDASAQGEPDGAQGQPDGAQGQPDGNNSCPVQSCTIAPQSGCCSNACDVNANETGAGCRQITAPGHETSECTDVGQCDAGYTCLGDSSDATCHKYCQADAFQWIHANPGQAPAKAVLMYAWNEFDEGGWICPTLHNGTDRIDAIAGFLAGP